MIGFACVGLAELFRMARDARPFALVAYAAAAALVVAAFYGTQFQIDDRARGDDPASSSPPRSRARIARGSRSRSRSRSSASSGSGSRSRTRSCCASSPSTAPALLVDVLVATFVADTAAYAGGRLFGRHRLAPALSPNKTLEGLAFGFVGGTMGFWFAGLYQDWLPGIDALLMGMCVAVAGAGRRPVRVDDQARPARSRTRARSSAPTAACSTASTRSCSPSSSATTSRSRSATERRPATGPRAGP